MSDLRLRFSSLEKARLPQDSFKKLVWNLFAFIGNIFFKRHPPNIASGNSDLNLLNLGAGGNKLEGFVNADFYRLHKLWSRDKPDWMVDITKPINCSDDYWDGILIEHTNEHILYTQNHDLMLELYRTLKPGGVIRIIVPDLDRYLDWSVLSNSEAKMGRYASLPEAISNLTQNHAHVSVWNFELLKELLVDIGFLDVVKTSYQQGALPELLKDSPKHIWQSVYVEAKKPYQVE